MEIKNSVVVRYRNGRMLKGFTYDFTPNKELFHVAEPNDDRKVTEVSTSDLKAVFYVKTFQGDKNHSGPKDFSKESLKATPGVKLKVTFADGEILYGTTNGYQPGRKGFFLMPADKACNNERVYVLSEATKSIETWR